MIDEGILLARFTISIAAKGEIETLRTAWNARFSDPAEVVAISWGEWRPDQGQPVEHVVVSFYGRSQHAEIAHGIQHVSGLAIVFFTIPLHASKFDGKVVDFTSDRGFFLRAP